MNPASGTPQAPSNSLSWGWLLLLGGLTALAPLSIDMYLPALPTIEQTLAAPPGTTSLTLAVFFVGMAVGQLFYGPLSDRFGRRKPLAVGLLLYVVASLGCAMASNIHALMVLRCLQALGGCAGPVIARAIVRDRCSAQASARVFSLLMLVMGLAPILAPLLGSTLLELTSWRGLFVSLALFGVACLAAIHWRLPETHDTRHAEPLEIRRTLRTYGNLLRNRAFLGYSLSGAFSMAGLFAYITGSPFVMIGHYQLSPRAYSLVFGATALALIVASQCNARLLQQQPLTTLLRRALMVPACAGFVLVALALLPTTPWWALSAGFMLSLGTIGFINPNASAAALATHGQQAGMASALMGAVQFALATCASTLVSLSHDGSSLPLASVMAVCGVSAWLVHRLLIGHQHDAHSGSAP